MDKKLEGIYLVIFGLIWELICFPMSFSVIHNISSTLTMILFNIVGIVIFIRGILSLKGKELNIFITPQLTFAVMWEFIVIIFTFAAAQNADPLIVIFIGLFHVAGIIALIKAIKEYKQIIYIRKNGKEVTAIITGTEHDSSIKLNGQSEIVLICKFEEQKFKIHTGKFGSNPYKKQSEINIIILGKEAILAKDKKSKYNINNSEKDKYRLK